MTLWVTDSMDIATVLLLQKASYIAGALTLTYVRYGSPESKGAGSLATSFIMLAVASTLAGFAETQPNLYAVLSLTNLVLAVLGYSLLGASFIVLSNPERRVPWSLIFVPAVLTLILGFVTQFHTANADRAAVFNLIAAAILGIAAFVVIRDARREPLSVRRLVSVVLAGCAALCLVVAVEFVTGSFSVLDVTTAFFILIISKFVMSLSVVIFINERQQSRLRHLAERDGLTGLYNRRTFHSLVHPRLAQGDAILYLDIDHFKRLNDNWGHAGGDDVLVVISRVMSALLPAGATVARQGGEEFVVHVPKSLGDGMVWAEKLRAAIQDAKHPSLSDTLSVTISVGLAIAEETTSFSHLCSSADRALYLAKASGRNRVCRDEVDDTYPAHLQTA